MSEEAPPRPSGDAPSSSSAITDSKGVEWGPGLTGTEDYDGTQINQGAAISSENKTPGNGTDPQALTHTLWTCRQLNGPEKWHLLAQYGTFHLSRGFGGTVSGPTCCLETAGGGAAPFLYVKGRGGSPVFLGSCMKSLSHNCLCKALHKGLLL